MISKREEVSNAFKLIPYEDVQKGRAFPNEWTSKSDKKKKGEPRVKKPPTQGGKGDTLFKVHSPGQYYDPIPLTGVVSQNNKKIREKKSQPRGRWGKKGGKEKGGIPLLK